MTLKGGSMVEVCRRNEGPFGSWYRARIISVDGQRYKVQYENILDVDRNSVMEEVYSEATRPVPPSMKGLGNWVVGDTIEVYDHHSWKIGKILKVLAGNFFIVKLLESRRERTCHQSNLRPRLSWQDGKWLRAQQAARNHYVRLEASQERASFAAFSQESHAGLQLQDLDVEFGAGNRKNGLTKTDSYLCKTLTSHVSLKATKRKPGIQMQSAYKEDFFNMEAAPQKRRAIQKSRNHEAVGESSRPLLEKACQNFVMTNSLIKNMSGKISALATGLCPRGMNQSLLTRKVPTFLNSDPAPLQSYTQKAMTKNINRCSLRVS